MLAGTICEYRNDSNSGASVHNARRIEFLAMRRLLRPNQMREFPVMMKFAGVVGCDYSGQKKNLSGRFAREELMGLMGQCCARNNLFFQNRLVNL